MSSTGLLFRSDISITPSNIIAAIIDWPQVSGAGPQSLLLHGHVIWCKAPLIGITFSRHAFIPKVGPAETLPAKVRVQVRRTVHSGGRALPPVLVVESMETHQLVSRILNRPIRRVGVKSACKMLRKDAQSISLLITNTLREFVSLNLSIPIIYVSPENDRQLDKIGLFPSIVVMRKPLTYGALLSAVRKMTAKSHRPT